MHDDRLKRLREEAHAAELHGVAVVPGPNLFYLTGLRFHLSERPVVAFLPVAGRALLLVPGLERTKAEAVPFEATIVTYDDVEGPDNAFAEALAELGSAGQWWGVEGRRIRFLELDLMARTGSGPRVFDAGEVFASQRMRKDDSELAAMRRAAAIAEEAFEATLPYIAAGRTEKQVAAELVVQLLRAGSDTTLPFSPIVASGPNGGNPHAFPTDRAARAGRPGNDRLGREPRRVSVRHHAERYRARGCRRPRAGAGPRCRARRQPRRSRCGAPRGDWPGRRSSHARRRQRSRIG